jgi:hypothetical protein
MYKGIYFDAGSIKRIRDEDLHCAIEIAVLLYFGSLSDDALGQNFADGAVLVELFPADQ